jgi:phage gp16-like protein
MVRTVVEKDGARRADLAAIHVAKKALGWDEDTYRDVLSTVCSGIRSSADLDHTGRKRWLAHLAACQAQAGIARPQAPKRAPWGPQLRKLWSLWQQLADKKLVSDRSREALQAWATNQTGVSRLEWMNAHQTDQIVNQAKAWLKRA